MFFRCKKDRCQKNLGRRGFSLTEMAVVFGIFGIVVSGVWLAAGNVYQKQQVEDAVNVLHELSSSARGIYLGRQNFPATSQKICEAGLFPARLWNPTGASACNTYDFLAGPVLPFGGILKLSFDSAGDPNVFIVVFDNAAGRYDPGLCASVLSIMRGGDRNEGYPVRTVVRVGAATETDVSGMSGPQIGAVIGGGACTGMRFEFAM